MYLRQKGKSFPVAKKYLPGTGDVVSTVFSDGKISFSDEFADMYLGNVAW